MNTIDSKTIDHIQKQDVVTVDDVTHRFGNLTVLEDVSLRLPAGTVTAVIGPNGSGKTTLSRIIAGLVTPTSGRVNVKIDSEHPIGYLPQAPQFRPALTVEETLEFYADLLSTSVDIEAALKQVGLVDVRSRQVNALSGGMLRLLGLAQSTLGSPQFLLLDEPWAALDHRMTNHILGILENLAKEDTSVLLTTHDLVSAEVADSIAIINNGQITARGSPEDIIAETEAESLSEAFLQSIGEEATVQTGWEEQA